MLFATKSVIFIFGLKCEEVRSAGSNQEQSDLGLHGLIRFFCPSIWSQYRNYSFIWNQYHLLLNTTMALNIVTEVLEHSRL